MKRLIVLVIAVLGWLMVFTPTAAQGGYWTGEYFNNANLFGPSVFTLNETTPSHDWGATSPSPLIPLDYFSARWTSQQNLTAGSYQLTVRADDGVRVYIDGLAYIDQWLPSPGNTYSLSISMVAGLHTIVVEYFEATGNGFLQYSLTPIGGSIPGTSATALVTTNELNVRDRPDPFTGVILTRIYQGQTYPLIGKNGDSSWLQLNANGIVGWVNARYVYATNLGLVPVTDPGTRPTGATATVTTGNLNVRDRPDPFTGLVLTRISRGQSYPVVGKNADASWLQLNVNGVVGWVNAIYVSATNLQNVPVTDNGTRPTGATATVITGNLNVRAVPNPYYGVIIARISLGQSFPVIGKNATGTWIQLNVNGLIGWVNASYMSAVNMQFLPITG